MRRQSDFALRAKLSVIMETAKPPIIFIDANTYLDLYRITKGQRLIDALTEQKDFRAAVCFKVTKYFFDLDQRLFHEQAWPEVVNSLIFA